MKDLYFKRKIHKRIPRKEHTETSIVELNSFTKHFLILVTHTILISKSVSTTPTLFGKV